MWQKIYNDKVQIFNDDKPAIRFMDGKWYAYGTPWCGKDGINQNKKVPLGGICFLKRGTSNSIRRLSVKEAVLKMIWQSNRQTTSPEKMEHLLGLIDKIVREIPVFEMECLPNEDAAVLSSTTMCQTAQEANL